MSPVKLLGFASGHAMVKSSETQDPPPLSFRITDTLANRGQLLNRPKQTVGPPLSLAPEGGMGPLEPLDPVPGGVPFPYDPTLNYPAPDPLSRQNQLAGLPPPPTLENWAALLASMDDQRLSRAAQQLVNGIDLNSPDADVPLMGNADVPLMSSTLGIDPDMARTMDTAPHPPLITGPPEPKPEMGPPAPLGPYDPQEHLGPYDMHRERTIVERLRDLSSRLRDLSSRYGKYVGPAALGAGGLGLLGTFLHNRNEEDEDKLRSYLPWLLLGGLGGYQAYKGAK